MTATEKTIPVPVSAIKALYEGADGVGAFGSTYHAVVALRALVPDPPKVGDTVSAEQIADLPDSSVLRDNDGDVLVKVDNKVFRATMDLRYSDTTSWDTARLAGLVNIYSPITLVSLPRG